MTDKSRKVLRPLHATTGLAFLTLTAAAFGQQVTYMPYLQLGDSGKFGPSDQMVVAWQTDESMPLSSGYRVDFGTTLNYGSTILPTGRVVDNYLSADTTLPQVASAYGAHSDYLALLTGLKYDTTYYYRVSGPGLGSSGFAASFHTRKQTPVFSFAVEGDEGFFPGVPNATPAKIVNYEARIAHLIYNAGNVPIAGAPARPPVEFVLNTGDNVYTTGSEDTYRDFFFPVLNNSVDSNETGAPLLRNMLYFIVAGNHDLGATGVSANMLADNAAPTFSGNTGGGDALAYFNNFYYPLNGPAGFDIQNTWNGDAAIQNGMVFSYQGQTYTSASAIEAYRASTSVDTGTGATRQIDRMSNYSFDYGNAHFLYLDANPHLFNGNLPGGAAYTTPPPPAFSAYPTALRNWIANDLDSTNQLWKVVVYHQPAFSSGDATVLNNQMRAVAKLLEDHGVNAVFNGHEHNYQRTLPIRAVRAAGTPSTTAGGPAVNIDATFDGAAQTVPDGVLYLVEGAGGNRDFDNNLAAPRGSGLGVDQDDAATGTFTPVPGLTVPQGPADWLDTNLTNREMVTNFTNAGTGPKITTKFKSKVFSFGQVVVTNNNLTLYQISEPLSAVSSATSGAPAPYGTDYLGNALNDPIPDTVLDGTTGALLSAPATGPSALLDKWSITKPDVTASVSVQLSAPPSAVAGGALVYTLVVKNSATFGLNGTQVKINLPANTAYAGATGENMSVASGTLVATIGRLEPGAQQVLQIPLQVVAGTTAGTQIPASAVVVSGTALPVQSNTVNTTVVKVPTLPKF